MGVVLSTCTTKIARILGSGRKRQAAGLHLQPPVASRHGRDSAGSTIAMIGLPELIFKSKTFFCGTSHP
jgi:hypothetical protein